MTDNPLNRFIKSDKKKELTDFNIVVKNKFNKEFNLVDGLTADEIINNNQAEFIRWSFVMAMQYPETKVGQTMAKELASKLIPNKTGVGQGGNGRTFSALNGLSVDQLQAIQAGELDYNDLILDADGVYKTKGEIKKEKSFFIPEPVKKVEAIRPDVGMV